MMNNEKQIDKTDICFNVASMYYFIFHTLSHQINFENFIEYLSCVDNKEVKNLISNICFQVSQILQKKPRTNKYKFYLSSIFYREPWRGQNLVLELLKKQFNTKKEILEEVEFWKYVEAKDL